MKSENCDFIILKLEQEIRNRAVAMNASLNLPCGDLTRTEQVET